MERDVTIDSTVVGSPVARAVVRRVAFTRWVRRTHGWFGLWGAMLGLIFGLSGVWLNHRAVLRLDLPAQHTINGQLALPETKFDSPSEMAIWLAGVLKVEGPPINLRVERSRPVAWSERSGSERGGSDREGAERSGASKPLMQPEHWSFAFGKPSRMIQVEYWRGNASVSVRTVENGFIATLTNVHKGIGMPLPWVLLVDTLAGSLIFLALSGLILWWETNRRRGLGIAIFVVSVTTTLGLVLWPLLT
jgi:uncharacterized protein